MENYLCESNIALVAKIHNFLENGAYHELVDLFEKSNSNSSLLWKENGSAGWTACHFAASQFMPTEWWEWIMNQASVPYLDLKNNFLHSKNALGQTVIDIFFRSYVRPLPWQSVQVKTRSKKFLAALEACLNGAITIEDLHNHYRICQTNRQQRQRRIFSRIRAIGGISIPTHRDNRIQRIVDFLIDLQILCRSILQAEPATKKQVQSLDEMTFLDALSRTGNCPDNVSRLLLKLFPNGTIKGTSAPENDSFSPLPILPLHQWCEAHTEYPEDDGMLECLLKIPDSMCHKDGLTSLASIPDPRSNKNPLLIAVQNGKSWSYLRPLVFADPSVLHKAVFLGLPIFAWTAISSFDIDERKKLRILYIARQNVVGEKGMISLWNLARSDVKQIALQNAAKKIECDHLTSIFEALIACPSALTDVMLRHGD